MFEGQTYHLTWYAIGPLTVGTLIALLGVLVSIWERGSRVSWTFLALSASVAIWLIGYGIVYCVQEPGHALYWIKAAHLGVCTIPTFVFLFTLAILRRIRSQAKWVAVSLGISLFFFLQMASNPAFLAGVRGHRWGYYAEYGSLSFLFLAFFLSVLILSLTRLVKEYKRTGPGRHRARLEAFMTAFAIGYLGCVDYLPAYRISVYPFGYVFVLVFIVLTARAIWRYHLVDLTPAFAAKQILQTMRGAILVVDTENRICVVNRSACELLGYQETEFAGMSIAEVIDRPFECLVHKGDIDSTAGIRGEIQNCETEWQKKDGRKLKVDMAVSLIADKGREVVGIVYAGWDISGLKEAEEALRKAREELEEKVAERTSELREVNTKLQLEILGRQKAQEALSKTHEELEIRVAERTEELRDVNRALEDDILERQKIEKALGNSEKRLRAIIQTANDAFIEMDMEGRVTDWNRQAESVFGWKWEEVIGRPLAELIIPPKYRVQHWKGLERFKSTCEGPVLNRQVELVALRRDGTEFPVELTVWPICEQGVCTFNAFIRDITERKKAQEAILEREAVEVKSQFVSVVSHELRTPLTAIKMAMEILTKGTAGKVDEDPREYIEMARRNVERLSRLINTVLDFQKLDAGQMEYERRRWNLNDVLLEMRETFLTLARDRGLAFEVELEKGLPPAVFDKDKIAEVLVNLIGNAIKFTERGTVKVVTRHQDGHVEVMVEDHGVGIHPDDIPKLFTHFCTISKGRRGKTGGTGLGLAISKKIVEQHGGEIWAESQYGRGSKFFFQLPFGEMVSIHGE